MSSSVSGQSAGEFLDIGPIARMTGTLRLPGSKSISNRSLLLAALSRGTTELTGLLDADDVDRMRESLRALGVRIEADVRHRDGREHRVRHGEPRQVERAAEGEQIVRVRKIEVGVEVGVLGAHDLDAV